MNKQIKPNLDQKLKDLKELANEFLDIFKNNIIYDIDAETLECLDLLENENLGG